MLSEIDYHKTIHKTTVIYTCTNKRTKLLKGRDKYNKIDYPEIWYKLFLQIYKEKQNYILIELHPSMAGQFYGNLPDEEYNIENIFKHEFIYSKTPDTISNLNTYIFTVSNIDEIKQLIYKWYEADQLFIYILNNLTKVNSFIKQLEPDKIVDRTKQLIELSEYDCNTVIQFHPNGIEMEVATIKELDFLKNCNN